MVSISPFGRDGAQVGLAGHRPDRVGRQRLDGAVRRPRPRPARPVRAPGLPPRRRPGAGAAVLALLERGRSGLGQHVDVSAQIACHAGHPVGGAEQPAPGRRWPAAPVAGWAAATSCCASSTRPLDGHVSITHVFGAAVGPATRRLMELVHDEGCCDEATRDKDWVSYGVQLTDGSEPLSELARVQACVSRTHLGARPRPSCSPRRSAAGCCWHRSPRRQEVLQSEQLASRGLLGRAGGAALPRAVGEDVGGAAATPAAGAEAGRAHRRRRRRLGCRRIDVESTWTARGEGGPGAGARRRHRPATARRASRSSTSCGRWRAPPCPACSPTPAPPSSGSNRRRRSTRPGPSCRSSTTRSASSARRCSTT